MSASVRRSRSISIRRHGDKAVTRSLKKSVEILMEELKKNPRPQYKRPPYPIYHNNGQTTVKTGN